MQQGLVNFFMRLILQYHFIPKQSFLRNLEQSQFWCFDFNGVRRIKSHTCHQSKAYMYKPQNQYMVLKKIENLFFFEKNNGKIFHVIGCTCYHVEPLFLHQMAKKKTGKTWVLTIEIPYSLVFCYFFFFFVPFNCLT